MPADPSKKHFWRSFLLAVETQPREPREIRGASGFGHPTLAIGVDEKRSRTVIVSGDLDARTAALAQADIQAAMPSMKIVMASAFPELFYVNRARIDRSSRLRYTSTARLLF